MDIVSMIILGLDVGDVRVGTALAESEGRRALPLRSFNRANGFAETEIIKLIIERGILKVVAGLPLDEYGQKTLQCEKIEKFCRRLQRRVTIEIVFFDEAFSSEDAKQRLNMSLKQERAARQKGVIDAVAASIILQSYLDAAPQRG